MTYFHRFFRTIPGVLGHNKHSVGLAFSLMSSGLCDVIWSTADKVRQLSRKTFLALTATYATSNTQRGIPELQYVTDMEEMYIYL